MHTRVFVLFISFLLFLNESHAQSKGILPFTGIRYFHEGVVVKNIEVKADGATLLSNRLPLNKEFEIRLQSATGFTEDRSKIIFAAAEISIVSQKGALLYNVANIFKDNEAKGLPAAGFKESIIKLTLKPEWIKADPACLLKIRFYDLKGKSQLRLEFPVTIAKSGESLQVSRQIADIKNNHGAVARSSGLKIKNMDITVDTSIRVAPKMAYASLDISTIEGTSITEVMTGKESFWVYDADLNEVKITDRQLKQVSGAMENNTVNYLSKIPYRLKNVNNKQYFVRFRWESTDKKKVIDVVVQK